MFPEWWVRHNLRKPFGAWQLMAFSVFKGSAALEVLLVRGHLRRGGGCANEP